MLVSADWQRIFLELLLSQAVDPATGDIVFDSFLDGESRQELETRISHLQPVEVLISVSPTRATDKLIQSLVAIRYVLFHPTF